MSYSRIGTALYGLGWDSAADGAYTVLLDRVVHLPSGSAPSVPAAIVQRLRAHGLDGEARWVEGGAMRITYRGRSDTGRRGAFLAAMAEAAEALGPNVYFQINGFGPHPVSRATSGSSGAPAPSGSGAPAQPHAPSPASPSSPPADLSPGDSSQSNDVAVPVALTAGAGILVLVGAFFLWKGSRRRAGLAANRRRRRRDRRP